ncbi:hypothetical protein CT19431_P60051 [Cupriavidus taiwanensis]|nr:hypothetical protein CT19431_P60051 [Cupriavidus taiwanensis]
MVLPWNISARMLSTHGPSASGNATSARDGMQLRGAKAPFQRGAAYKLFRSLEWLKPSHEQCVVLCLNLINWSPGDCGWPITLPIGYFYVVAKSSVETTLGK